ncbi:MAG: MBL fold metallo-hydrolase, partial [Acidimicrobiales bacterium]|nr:MBL fold metallo-hydrolase [Acidimicrobiales bacterium]
MDVRIDEVADLVYRFSTFVPDVGPTGFTFNQ